MNIGEFYFTDKLGTIKVSKIEVDENSNPKIIEVESKEGSHRILMQYAKLRKATPSEINQFGFSEPQGNEIWYELETEFPRIRSIFRTWIYEETKNFLDKNPQLIPTKYGASTNVFYCEYLLCLDQDSNSEPYKFRHWNHYNFNDDQILSLSYQEIKPKLQEFIFGEGQYDTMTGENNHQVQIKLKDIVVESFLIIKETLPKLKKCTIEIQDHDEIDSEADIRLKRIMDEINRTSS